MPCLPPEKLRSTAASPRAIAVFLGAKSGNSPKYEQLARDIAAIFAKNSWKLVYGGSARGLMGTLGRTAAAMGAEVYGVKPAPFLKYELNGALPDWGHNELVGDLYTQKRRMTELTDTFLVLPGGFGTLEELMAIRMWSKLGVCRRPIILLNFDGYYNPLLNWMSLAIGEGFVTEDSVSVITIVDNADELAEALQALPLSKIVDTGDNLSWSVLSPCHDVGFEKAMFNAADRIALRYALMTQWSTWHTWNYVREHKHEIENAEDIIWEDISPYATCVGMTFPVAKDLNAAFGSTPGLEQYVKKIKTLASREPDSSGIERPYHCLVAVCLDQYCIVIDLVFSPDAFTIPLDGFFETKLYFTTSRSCHQRRFRYSLGSNGENLLSIEKVGHNEPAALFSEIDHRTALQQISIRAAQETEPGTTMPKKKCIVIRKVVLDEPIQINATRLDAGYIICSCRLQVDFLHKRLTIQIPNEDWLLKPRNARYLPLQQSSMYRPINGAVVNLSVNLNMPRDDDTTVDQLKAVSEVGERLRLPSAEIMQIAGSVYDVWHNCSQ